MASKLHEITQIPEKPHELSRQGQKILYTFILFSLFTTLTIILLSMDKPKGFVYIHIISNLNLLGLSKVLFDNLCRKSLGLYMINQIVDKLKRFVLHNINNSNSHEFSKILFDNLGKRKFRQTYIYRMRTSYIALTTGNQ